MDTATDATDATDRRRNVAIGVAIAEMALRWCCSDARFRRARP